MTAPKTSDSAVEFLIRFVRVAHEAGYPTADLEDRVLALAGSLELTGPQVSATPTLVEVSLGSIPHQRTFTVRVRPAAVDLDAIARIDDLVQDVLAGPLSPEGSGDGACRGRVTAS
jgi:uncharacterized membrane protein YjjP (DUF1212 family)